MKRALIAAIPAVLVLGLVACGDDDDAPTTVENTTPSVGSEEPDTTDDELSDLTLPGGITVPDLGSVLPGGSLPDFTIPGDLSIPDLSLPENAEEILRSVFPNLDDDQLSCLVDELGGDIDPSRVPDLMNQCGIDPSDLIPG
jgi:hypothetical protein